MKKVFNDIKLVIGAGNILIIPVGYILKRKN